MKASETLPWLALAGAAFVVVPWLRRLRPGDGGGPAPQDLPCDAVVAPSFPAQWYAAAADAVHIGFDDITEDEEAVAAVLMLARSDRDVCELVRAYGERRVLHVLGPYTLPAAVRRYMMDRASLWSSDTWVDVINADYAEKGISWRW